MKITKKNVYNIAFIVLIALMIIPTTKVYFIRLISFSPSVENKADQKQISQTDWYLKGLNTKTINFNETEGAVVFVNFWATWCPPCIAEMPEIKELYADYKNKIKFLFITNENREVVEKFFKKNNYDFPVYNTQSAIPKELQSRSIPATFIISKNRKIVVEKKGAASWNSDKTRRILETLLQEKTTKK